MPNYHTPQDYLDAAESPDTPPEELAELAKAPYPFVVVAVANNPHTESTVLTSLAPSRIESREEQELAAAMVRNPSTPLETLGILAERLVPVLDNGRHHHRGFEAGILLCRNPRAPIQAIATMLHPERAAMQFRKVAARETRRRDVLELLLADRSAAVRRMAQKRIQALDAGQRTSASAG